MTNARRKTLHELIREWNHGVSRGAMKRFADKFGVNRVTLSRWASGKLKPGEEALKAMAKELNVPEHELAYILSVRFSKVLDEALTKVIKEAGEPWSLIQD